MGILQNFGVNLNVGYIKQSLFVFSISLKSMNQDCVDAAVASNAQNDEAIERELEAQMFRCSSPQNPLMCEKDRLRTFPQSWYNQVRPTPREPGKMVNAGFYCKGSGDCVLCFYCGGGLFYCKPHDNPWYKHAKWFPMC